MNITIKPGAATEDALQIDSIIEEMTASMEELNEVIKSVIPAGVETDWSEDVLNNWNTYYGSNVPETLEEMKLSSANLRLAVAKALEYSQSN